MMHIPYLSNYGYHVHGQTTNRASGFCPQMSMSPGSPPNDRGGITSAHGYEVQTNYQQILANVSSHMSQQTKPFANSFMIDSILGLTSQHRPYDLSVARERQSRMLRISSHERENSNNSSRKICDKTGTTVKNSKKSSDTGKPKRIRTIFTPEQLERLEGEFERQQYMVGPERVFLASTLNLTEAQVKVWFQNRRIKWRKQHLEIEHAQLAKLRNE